jgi:hypothetical protein
MDEARVEDENGDSETLKRAAAGEADALRGMFAVHRDRLKRMVHLRLSRRLASGRELVTWRTRSRLSSVLCCSPGCE